MKRLTCALLAMLGCASPASVERVFPPRPSAEAADSPRVVSARREFHGTRLGALEFRGRVEFEAPNRFRETRTFDPLGATHELAFDGRSYTRDDGAGRRELGGTDARAVFDRCLEEALLFRTYETEPSLAIRELPEIAEFEGRAARAFEVAHGSSGFSRVLYFDPASGSLLAMEGSRWNGGTFPIPTVIRFLESRSFAGKELPTKVEIVEDGRPVETITYHAVTLQTEAPGVAATPAADP